jgi:hypothetical protein
MCWRIPQDLVGRAQRTYTLQKAVHIILTHADWNVRKGQRWKKGERLAKLDVQEAGVQLTYTLQNRSATHSQASPNKTLVSKDNESSEEGGEWGACGVFC